MPKSSNRVTKPSWLRAKLPAGPQYSAVRGIVDQNQFLSHTLITQALKLLRETSYFCWYPLLPRYRNADKMVCDVEEIRISEALC